MSKKIAQLTKVIYYLNTKNEDHLVEIQSFIDAYEDELNEVIKDGTSQVDVLNSKVEMAERKMKESDITLQAYVKTIESQEQELRTCYSREETLKETVQYMEFRAAEANESNLRSIQDLTRSRNSELDLEKEERFQEMVELHKEEVDKLKRDNEKAVKDLLDELKSVHNSAKETTVRMAREMEELKEENARKLERMKNDFTTDMENMEMGYKKIQKGLQDEVEHVTKRYKDVAETLETVQRTIKSQRHEIQELQESIMEKDQFVFEAQGKLEVLARELEVASTGLINTKGKLDVAERKLIKVEAAMVQLEIDLNTKRELALQEQEAAMTAASEKKLADTVWNLNAQHDLIVNQKDAEMFSTLLRHRHENEQWVQKLEKERDGFLEVKNFMQDQLDKMEEAKNAVKEKYETSLKTLQERVNEIQEQARVIQTQIGTIKGLEVDKADLFQKMVRIDDQIRGELNEKFRIEKMASEEKWEMFHATEMQKQLDRMTHDHHIELMVAIDKVETDYKTVIQGLKGEHALQSDEYNQSKTVLEDRILGYEINIKMMTKGIADLKEDHARKFKEEKEKQLKEIERISKNFEYEINAKETQLKVAHTITLGNLEKKHATVLEELDGGHKRMMDDLRNTHTKNTITAKKDAESRLLAETTRLKTVHDEAMKLQATKNAEERAQVILKMNMDRMTQLKEQADLHQMEVDKMNRENDNLNEEIFRRIGVEDDYSKKVYKLESEIARHKDTITKKCDEILIQNEKIRDRHIIALDTQMESLMAEYDAKIYNLNEEHILEANKMIKDFEQAQEYLKKQIANQVTLLEEAALKYINRESRDDDLATIASLHQDIQTRKRRQKVMLEELEYCKLELSNREANFNKIFNKHPLVGVIKPYSVGTAGGMGTAKQGTAAGKKNE
ncbi:hypothetical protein HDU98_009837 [Podochytrium sp. JEL0797]|nr:hypothetical protein HDU98_009837 [Podochytrium sp. JEL0797]